MVTLQNELIHLAFDRVQLRAVVQRVTNLQAHMRRRIPTLPVELLKEVRLSWTWYEVYA